MIQERSQVAIKSGLNAGGMMDKMRLDCAAGDRAGYYGYCIEQGVSRGGIMKIELTSRKKIEAGLIHIFATRTLGIGG